MEQPERWLLGSYGQCWAGVLRPGRTHRWGGNNVTAFWTTASLINRGQEDTEIMYGIISRTSCLENKALKKKAS